MASMSSNPAGEGAASDVDTSRCCNASLFFSGVYDSAEVFCDQPEGHGGDHQTEGTAHDENGNELRYDLQWRS